MQTTQASARIVTYREIEGNAGIAGYKQLMQLALRQAGFGDGERWTDPLAIDLDGDGLELLSQARGTFFEVDNDGYAEPQIYNLSAMCAAAA